MDLPVVKINNQTLEAVAEPGSYLAIRRVWRDGDTISVGLPMELRQEGLPGNEPVAAILYGPLVLAADLGPGPTDVPNKVIHSGDTSPAKIPSPDPLPKAVPALDSTPDQWIQTESKSELRFKVAGEGANYELMPMYRIRDQRYSVYWQMEAQKKKS